MRCRALCWCLALCVESLLVFILLNETLEEEVEEGYKGEWAKGMVCDIF